MAMNEKPVFAKTPKTSGITFGAASQDTSLDPAVVTPSVLVTAGADGALVTSVKYNGQVTSALEKLVLWIQPLGTGNWYLHEEYLQAAYTQAATTVQAVIKMVDKEVPDQAIRLAGTDKLGVTHHVDQKAQVIAEYSDFSA